VRGSSCFAKHVTTQPSLRRARWDGVQVFWIGPKTTRAASFMQGIEAFLHDRDSENIGTSTTQPIE
jgi:hypothetical protein